jgi:hypothetical protein
MQLANMFRPDSTAVPTAIALTNVELCYRQISMGAEVEAMVRAMPSISLRTQSFLNTASVLGAATSGQVALVYNQRVASIKSAFLAFASTQTDSNLWGDSADVTKGNGSYSLTIAGQQYPQNPYSILPVIRMVFYRLFVLLPVISMISITTFLLTLLSGT